MKLDMRAIVDLSRLGGLSAKARDLRPVWLDAVQPLVTAYLTQRFASEGAHLGTKWAPHAPVTTVLRQRPGHGRGGIGRDTGVLWASLVKSAGATAAPGGFLVIDPLRYERGTTVRYARFFAGGFTSTTVPRFDKATRTWRFVRRAAPKAVPARPIWTDPLPPALLGAIKEAVVSYLASPGRTSTR